MSEVAEKVKSIIVEKLGPRERRRRPLRPPRP